MTIQDRTGLLPHQISLRLAGFVVAAVCSGSAWAAADNAIESVSASRQGSDVIVRVNLKNAPANQPISFSINSPARIALDFPDTANATGSTSREINLGDVRNLNLVQAGDRSRLVVNLKRPMTYSTSMEGKTLVLKIDGTGQAATTQEPPAAASTRPLGNTAGPAQKTAIRDVDFRRGPAGEGRVVVDLPGAQAGVDVRQQGQAILVDFLQTALPDVLRRRMDVADFGTPVRAVTTVSQGENVRMTIEPKGTWEYSAYQSDTQLVVEVRSVKEDPNRLGPDSQVFRGEKVSLDFQNVSIHSVLKILAEESKLNIITSPTVAGNLTLRLKDVPWDQALDIVMQATGLDMRRKGNVVWIAPKEELLTKEKLELEQRSQIAELEPVRTETFELNYQKADAVKALLDNAGGRGISILTKRGSAMIDLRTNQVFVTDIPAKLEEVRKLVQKVDIASRQVLIEARIVEANDTFSRNLGAKLGFGVQATGNGATAAVGGTLTSAGTGGSAGTVSGSSINLPAQGISGAIPGSVALTLFNSAATRFISLELSALESDGKGKILSSPRVITADKLKAVIEQGTELPYQTATSSGATSLAFRKANLRLEVVPQITPDGNVILDVSINKDSVGQATLQGFAIDTKHVKTQVLIDNGGTVVIGGIYIQQDRNTEQKVPLLGDIPVVGNLFKQTARTNDKTELLIFLTPKVLNDKVAVR